MADVATDTLWTGRFLKVVRRGTWEYVARHGSSGVVGVVATTDTDELVLVEQHRPPVGCRVVELPAGLIGDGDDGEDSPVAAGGRELEEETGFTATSITPITRGVVSAGLTDEAVDLVRATGLTRVGEGGGVDASEDIEVHVVPLAEVPAFLRARMDAGRQVDLKVWAGLWCCDNWALPGNG